MANFCRNCGRELPFLNKFSSNSLCDDCEEALRHKLPAELANIEESVKASHTCTAEQLETLQQYELQTRFDFYYNLCFHFSTRLTPLTM
jgi:predicted amidophosphoribosyltransferase